ncbi:PhzF family phenazine biosynthesis protein [Corynebacterium camporealensis]|uniref:Phenazine biosynthesis protein PhzF family n=1 Tax=Corynebacterium camporealensis TaxID=161896 RepID=A0A0F6QYT1_9CORY|nr:PhzF family phenazine biosynthesis protein [Corynebacterium camporealensis]AKE39403.1 phenazine biosynthesis protein PhzF family [Corynebacterium camporealensis]MDY5841133.1 PhzF family phenazine biosynthesis protein [Corynebacterium camporealensis]
MSHPFFEVDVFATTAFSGNPLAVIANADDLSTEQMQSIAAWTNFSETTFLLKPTNPQADYRVRIFTPQEEFDFAGHPTLGTARVFKELHGTEGTVVQECNVGLVTVREEGGVFSFATPALRKSGPLSAAELQDSCSFLGVDKDAVVDAAWVDNGPGWRLVQLADAASVRNLQPTGTPALKVGVVGMEGDSYEVRAFTPRFEDPVTGSFNGGAAEFMRAKGAVPASYIAYQGSQVGRNGEVHIHDDGEDIWVGGHVNILVEGSLNL